MVFEKIRNIISQQLDIDKETIKMNTSFEEIGVDSLELFQIIIDIEDEFGVQIDDEELVKTVGDAVNFVVKYNK
ncbi:acyl carrier protein [Clostridium sp. cel8]|jgi:acyl carrier protein|uniref:acyl carrier protein n=1 Tax=Clostridium sp. cel8 TaxID=2663123 RepID=UPI0015F76986|nr:acyl carrier protein [Clostridium sp. cel8]MBA5851691.1 acyl carrier protein [Clostridium sp. cel8]